MPAEVCCYRLLPIPLLLLSCSSVSNHSNHANVITMRPTPSNTQIVSEVGANCLLLLTMLMFFPLLPRKRDVAGGCVFTVDNGTKGKKCRRLVLFSVSFLAISFPVFSVRYLQRTGGARLFQKTNGKRRVWSASQATLRKARII